MSALRRRVAAYGLLRDAAGQVLLVPAGTGQAAGWTLPGGTVRHGESPRVAVARLTSAQAGVAVRVRAVCAATADQAPGLDGAVVHHDRLVFEVEAAGARTAPAPPAGWFGAVELAAARLPGYTRTVLGLSGEPAMVADPDDGWPVVRGLASDSTGARPRVQRFSTYALATDPAGRVLLARIAAGFPGAGRWHLPGGGTNVGESPDAALLREVVEETGQHGRVVGLLDVLNRHNPGAIGWEGYPIDWHTIRVVYRVVVDRPGRPQVTEAAGGSTADAAWLSPHDALGAGLTDLAAGVLKAGIPAVD